MNVEHVQGLLKNLGSLLAANQGGKPAAEFEAFCNGLEPFRELPIGTFAAFLRDAAEYRRTGVVPVPEAKKSRSTRGGEKKAAAPKAKAKSKNDTEAVQAAATRLQVLYDRFADPTLTAAIIDAEVNAIDKEFDTEGLKAVARAFGITGGMASKSVARMKIHERIVERKDRYERSEAFSAGGQPAISDSAAEASGVEEEPLVEEVRE